MDMRSFVAALPKAELHVHLVGAASVDTVLELARRHPHRGVPTDRAELAKYYEFTDFAHFIQVIGALGRLVTTEADVVTLLVGLARDLAANQVRYAEVTVTPVNLFNAGIDDETLVRALATGRERAKAEHGVELNWIYDIPGEQGVEAGWRTVNWYLDHKPEHTVGFGLGGPEIGVPRGQFKPMFDLAREAGLPSVPHAGETTGPESVWSAIHDLGAVRIGHGIHSVQDPELVAYLAEHRIPLEISPHSNLRTREVLDLADHPLPKLLAAGVPVVLNTDDPGMFDTDLNREYLAAHEKMGLTAKQLVEIARTGVEVSFAGAATKARLLAELDSVTLPG
ncbi:MULTISPECIES: adenosine deaminase [unclassified Crossiella]|uniref:adenosine deaminase n=1 Tax=unclassified Crossiella TaxID=2620835 RepID=UPI001FFE5540|nr:MULTISPECIES: adenosine deaminase [unclassified Crossiella]MCK2240329.1 adenosine deaminase [Crossiella sp. S99.2]MCK2253219.1 adenosine deaminase [Crossiella sp. S99.1]